MTPQDIAVVTAMTALIDKIGGWPLMTILVLIIIGPWVMAFFLARAAEKRHEAAIAMYDHNVHLVEKTLQVSEALKAIAQDQQGYMVQNTQVLTELAASIRQNEYCPLQRLDKKTVEVGR